MVNMLLYLRELNRKAVDLNVQQKNIQLPYLKNLVGKNELLRGLQYCFKKQEKTEAERVTCPRPHVFLSEPEMELKSPKNQLRTSSSHRPPTPPLLMPKICMAES